MNKDISETPSLSDDMQPVLWILRFLTITPFSIEKGRVYFSWQSWPMAWAWTSFILMSIYAVYVFRIKYSDLFNESHTFSDAVYFVTFLELLHHHFVSPLVHWPEARGLAEYFQCWNDFQMEFQKITGRPLSFGLRHKGWFHFALTLAIPALLCIVLTSYLKPIGNDELFPFISSGMFHAVMPRTWNMFQLAVVRSAESLQGNFDTFLLPEKGDYEATRVVKDFRRLWTKLGRLAAAPGHFWGVTTIHFLVYCLVTLLMSAFGLMAALQQGSLSYRGKALACLVVDNTAHAWIVCTAGYSSCEKVNNCMRHRLLELKLKSSSVAFRQEVETFLRVLQDCPSKIWLSGFFILNRALFCAMMSTVVTYLCVLSQFGEAVNQLYQ